jgi:DNA repair protein RadC
VFIAKLGEGALSEVTVNKAAFFQAMILSNAAGCIFVHNHPSGQARPSREDDKLTSELKAGMLLPGYSFLNHLIITADEYFSYADEGRL